MSRATSRLSMANSVMTTPSRGVSRLSMATNATLSPRRQSGHSNAYSTLTLFTVDEEMKRKVRQESDVSMVTLLQPMQSRSLPVSTSGFHFWFSREASAICSVAE